MPTLNSAPKPIQVDFKDTEHFEKFVYVGVSNISSASEPIVGVDLVSGWLDQSEDVMGVTSCKSHPLSFMCAILNELMH